MSLSVIAALRPPGELSAGALFNSQAIKSFGSRCA